MNESGKREQGVVKQEMTMEEIQALPNMLGKIASAMCRANGEYKCRLGATDKSEGIKTHIILVGS